MPWFVQVKYRERVAEAAAGGWVTMAIADDMRQAARSAAEVYRSHRYPGNGYPDQLRVRSEQELVAGGGEDALRAALESFEAYCRMRAAAESADR